MTELKYELGLLVEKDNFKVIKKRLKKGEEIAEHTHEGNNVLLTVTKGMMDVMINQQDHYLVEPGKVLSFEGENSMSAKLMEDSEFFVTLINK